MKYYSCVEVAQTLDKYKVIANFNNTVNIREFNSIQEALHFAHSLESREETKHSHDPVEGCL